MSKRHNESDSDDASSEVSQRGTLTRDTRPTGQDGGSAGTLEYTANIAAACDAVNAESRRSRSPSEVHRLEKRRESNRLSARRCRRRRREEMNELSEELKRQSSINEALALEQKVLKEELDREIQSLQQGNNQVPIMPVPKAAPPSQVSIPMGNQDQALQSLLGAMIQNCRPPVPAPVPEMSAANALASFLNNPSSQSSTGLPQDALAAFLNNAALNNAALNSATLNNAAAPTPTSVSSHDAFAAFLANSAATNTNNMPLSQEALAAASLMLGGASQALTGYPTMSVAAPVASPALYSRPAADSNDFSARLARLEAAMNPVSNQSMNPVSNQPMNPVSNQSINPMQNQSMNPMPNQAISSDLLRMLLGGQAGAPMPPYGDPNQRA